MKKLLALFLMLLPAIVKAQPALWWGATTITTNIRNTAVVKNDTIALDVALNPNFSTIRSVYFDFQHQKDALQFLDVTPLAAIPTTAAFSYTNNFYPNCKFNRTAQNTTNNGYDNWMNANYTCNSTTVPYHAINRIMVNVANSGNLAHAMYVRLRFKVTNTTAGFPYDSIYMNFAVGYDAAGNVMTTTQNVGAKGVWVQLAPGANNLLSGNIKQSPNTSNGLQSAFRLSITDTTTNTTEITNSALSSGGTFAFGQQLTPNTWYRMRLLVPADSVARFSMQSVTVSDYTMAQQEFITQNLDRTYKNQNIDKGIKYWAADVNNNGAFDGGDLQKLFNAVAGLDTLFKAPAGCGINCYVSMPLITAEVFDTANFADWKNITTNHIQFKTSQVEQSIYGKYLLKGDVNLSHSSPLTQQTSNAMFVMGDLIVPGTTPIEVNVNNVVVTSNNISIPFTVDTKTNKLTGLQFEVKYDPSKVKFEKLEVNTPSWVSFVGDNNSVIRFGALDRELKNLMTGSNLVPFKLQFSSLRSGVDLNSAVEIYPTMDAADDKGKQVGINFNTTVIKLIGANFFKTP